MADGAERANPDLVLDLLRRARREVWSGNSLILALQARTYADADHEAAIRALYRRIPLWWRMLSGSWSSSDPDAIRNYFAELRQSKRLSLIDDAIQSVERTKRRSRIVGLDP